jgi:hypothetical protein
LIIIFIREAIQGGIMKILLKITIGLIGLSMLAACTSGQIKARKAQRDQQAQESKIYCDFVNGEQFPDVEVQTNLEMAKHCDPDKSMTVTGYRSPSEAVGLVYCCKYKDNAGAESSHPATPAKK